MKSIIFIILIEVMIITLKVLEMISINWFLTLTAFLWIPLILGTVVLLIVTIIIISFFGIFFLEELFRVKRH